MERASSTRGREVTGRDRVAEGVILIALVASLAATVGLGTVYALGGDVQLEGILLAVGLGGISIALGLWAKRYMPVGNVVEERPGWHTSAEERAAFAADFNAGERNLTRRATLVAALGAAAAALGAVALFPFRSLGPAPLGALRRTAWTAGSRLVDDDGEPLHRDDVALDTLVTVFPEGVTREERADTQTVLLRLRPGALRARPGREDWAPDGFVAYSKICTHAGCPVGLYQAESHQLVCPCHQSLFDVTDGARPVFGPATRSLPQLPIAIDDDGYLVAQRDYPVPVGPGFWSFGT